MSARKHRKLAALLAILAASSLASCSWQEVVDGQVHTHWVVVDTDNTTFDARHGDQIDVVLTGPDQSPERCDSYGGHDLVWHPEQGGFVVCEDVDF